jgi:hypothetical protein
MDIQIIGGGRATPPLTLTLKCCIAIDTGKMCDFCSARSISNIK